MSNIETNQGPRWTDKDYREYLVNIAAYLLSSGVCTLHIEQLIDFALKDFKTGHREPINEFISDCRKRGIYLFTRSIANAITKRTKSKVPVKLVPVTQYFFTRYQEENKLPTTLEECKKCIAGCGSFSGAPLQGWVFPVSADTSGFEILLYTWISGHSKILYGDTKGYLEREEFSDCAQTITSVKQLSTRVQKGPNPQSIEECTHALLAELKKKRDIEKLIELYNKLK